jgi:hypothetical protein
MLRSLAIGRVISKGAHHGAGRVRLGLYNSVPQGSEARQLEATLRRFHSGKERSGSFRGGRREAGGIKPPIRAVGCSLAPTVRSVVCFYYIQLPIPDLPGIGDRGSGIIPIPGSHRGFRALLSRLAQPASTDSTQWPLTGTVTLAS